MIEGWAFPPRAQRAHYFIGTVALCGNWNFYYRHSLNAGYSSEHCCEKCKSRLAAREAARKKENEDAG